VRDHIDSGGGYSRRSESQVAGAAKEHLPASIAIEHRRLTDRLSYQAQHDALTGLPNRFLLGDRLEQAIAYANRHRSGLAVLLLDLDGFKYINDSLGHQAGDQVLVEVSRRLRSVTRQVDTVTRIGGDEFCLVAGG
jgi:GGDEF domain-containing protein